MGELCHWCTSSEPELACAAEGFRAKVMKRLPMVLCDAEEEEELLPVALESVPMKESHSGGAEEEGADWEASRPCAEDETEGEG